MISRRPPVAVSTTQKHRSALGTRRGTSVLVLVRGIGREGGSTQDSSVVRGAGVTVGLLEGVGMMVGEGEAVGVGVAVAGVVGVGDGGGEGVVGLEEGVSVASLGGADGALHAASSSAMTSQRCLRITSELLRRVPRRVDAYGEPPRSSLQDAIVRRCRRDDQRLLDPPRRRRALVR